MKILLKLLGISCCCIILHACDGNFGKNGTGIEGDFANSDNKYYQQAIADSDLKSCFENVNLEGIDGDIPENGEKKNILKRLVIAMDASGSMAGEFGGQPKIAAAKKATIDYLSKVPESVQVGFIAFGHKGSNEPAGKDASCAGVELLYSLQAPNRSAIETAVNSLKPNGYTPLAKAIEMAASKMENTENEGEQVVWIVSDGKETCGGDPVAIAKKANQGQLKLVVNIVGFDLKAADRQQLKAVADAGGGEFLELDADNINTLAQAVEDTQARLSTVVDGAMTKTNNSIKTGQTAATTNICITQKMAKESTSLNLNVTAQKEASKEELEEARKLLKKRHERVRELYKSYETSLQNKEEAKAKEIGAELKGVLDGISENN